MLKADASQSRTEDEEYEANMQAAIAASRGEAPPGQENGIVGRGQQFGPAHRGDYEPKQWAMTLSRTRAQEVPDNPPPALRRRHPEEPAFLRPSRSGYLHSLLTIYHSIPLARAALLLPSVQNVSYGHDSEWWSGTRIVAPRVVSYDDRMVHHSDADDFVFETQRLMAFLDGTTRSYGSADALVDLDCYRNSNTSSELVKFFDTWINAALGLAPDEPLTQVFCSQALRNPMNPREQITRREFHCIEPNYRDELETLYDVLDLAIWADTPNQPLDDVWIEHVAPVFTLCLRDSPTSPPSQHDGVNVKIPAVWYPDRYLESCKQQSQEMRARMVELSHDIDGLVRLYRRYATHLGRGTLDVRQTLLEAARATELAVRDQPLTNGLHEGSDVLPSGTPLVSSAEGDRCAQELRGLVERIDQKMRSLEEQKERTHEVYRRVAQQFTQPSSDPNEPPTHRYTLRGVSTKPQITYVLRPVVEDLMDTSDGNSGEAQDEFGGNCTGGTAWQWWRISFSAGESHSSGELPVLGPPTQAEAEATETLAMNGYGQFSDWSRKIQQAESRSGFSVRKVREVEVLKAAREESKSVLLVYANDEAINLDPSHVPGLTPELRDFVETDNAAFERELRGESGAEMASVSTAYGNGKLVDDDDMETIPPASPKRQSDGAASPPKRSKNFDDQFTCLPTPPEDPPPYAASEGNEGQEMQETGNGSSPLTTGRANRIGQHAERMMARIDESDEAESGRDSNQL
jgi:hypothetical protein